MRDKHASTTKQYTTKKTTWLGTAQVSKKIRIFLPEWKMVAAAIEYRISSMLMVSYRWIKKNMKKDILNYYYSVDNYTWLCDKFIILQS